MDGPVPGVGQDARPLPPDLAGVLQDLAQALLNLEHALSFYPEGHQSRQAPLARLLAMLRAEAAGSGEASLAFSGEMAGWREAIYDSLPPAARKLATLLASQGISRLRWSSELTIDEVEGFLTVLARGRAAGRRQAWDPAVQFEHLWVESLDYQALMAQDAGEQGLSAERRGLWQALLLRLLADPTAAPAAGELALLREAWEDPAALAALLTETIGPGALEGSPDAVEPVRRFAGLVERAAAEEEPLPAAESAQKLGAVARQLPAALRLRLLEASLEQPETGVFAEAFGSLSAAESVALMAETFTLDPNQIGRLTRVFQHLVPRQLERMELAPQLREGVRQGGDPDEPLAENTWEEVQELLTGESGEFMSPAYQEQLRRLATREEARRGAAASLAELPDRVADLAPARTARESLWIQFEQLRLATSLERFHDALEGVGGLCSATLAAGDRDRGLLILRRLLHESTSDELPVGTRAEIERTLRTIASPTVVRGLLSNFGSLGDDDRAAVRALLHLAPAVAAPVLLDALADGEDAASRKDALSLLQSLGAAALPEMLGRLGAAAPAVVRSLLPLLGESRDPVAVPALLSLLGRDDARMRRDVLRALVNIDSPEVRRALPALLEDDDSEIVQIAAAQLGAVGSPETVRALLKTLEPGLLVGRRVREMQRVILVLGRMRAAEAVKPLAELLRRRAWINRSVQEKLSEAAAQALARIGGDAAKQALEQVAARGNEGLAATCRRLLARWETT